MDFTLTSAADSLDKDEDVQPEVAAGDGEYRLSPRPVVSSDTEELVPGRDDLRRSYASETLCLMARDAHTLLAYWDIDWAAAFGEDAPVERPVHLRITSGDGGSDMEIEVQPTASGQIIENVGEDASYIAELGCYTSAGEWKPVATSAAVDTPPASMKDGLEAGVATVPFHLSFQRMLDVLSKPAATQSLTEQLADLRTRAAAEGDFTVAQRELVDTLDEAVAKAPPITLASQSPRQLWTQESLQQILGFSPSSPAGGFSGSSRSA